MRTRCVFNHIIFVCRAFYAYLYHHIQWAVKGDNNISELQEPRSRNGIQCPSPTVVFSAVDCVAASLFHWCHLLIHCASKVPYILFYTWCLYIHTSVTVFVISTFSPFHIKKYNPPFCSFSMCLPTFVCVYIPFQHTRNSSFLRFVFIISPLILLAVLVVLSVAESFPSVSMPVCHNLLK